MNGPSADHASPKAVLLCDADGNLFPSEELAFVPSTTIVNRFLAELGSRDRFTAEELRAATTGMTFRSTISALAEERRIPLSPEVREQWVEAERVAVTEYLGSELRPNPWVREALERLAGRYRLIAVSSSAHVRLDASFEATDLADLFPPECRFSAEDSLPVPTSKPDPAIYAFTGQELGIEPGQALAVEDSLPGVQSAVGAGFDAVGNVVFVPTAERPARTAQLLDAGAGSVVASWTELASMLLDDGTGAGGSSQPLAAELS